MNTVTDKAVEAVQPLKKVRSLRRLVPNAVSRPVGRAGLHLQHKSPEILFAAGIGLGVATVVTACKATLSLQDELNQLESDLDVLRQIEERGNPDNVDLPRMTHYVKARSVTKIAKLYAPSLALGVMAVASLTGSHHIMNKRNVAMTAAYAAIERSFDEYRQRVVAKYGEDEDKNIMFAGQERVIVEEDEKGKVTKKVVKSFGEGRSPYSRLFAEGTSKAWKQNAFSNRTFIQCQQNWANDMLQMRGHLFLNEVHDLLGLDRTSEGQIVGWVLGNGDNFVDFGIFDRQHTDERVHEFMFGEEGSIMLDFNVDGPVWELLNKLNTNNEN